MLIIVSPSSASVLTPPGYTRPLQTFVHYALANHTGNAGDNGPNFCFRHFLKEK